MKRRQILQAASALAATSLLPKLGHAEAGDFEIVGRYRYDVSTAPPRLMATSASVMVPIYEDDLVHQKVLREVPIPEEPVPGGGTCRIAITCNSPLDKRFDEYARRMIASMGNVEGGAWCPDLSWPVKTEFCHADGTKWADYEKDRPSHIAGWVENGNHCFKPEVFFDEKGVLPDRKFAALWMSVTSRWYKDPRDKQIPMVQMWEAGLHHVNVTFGLKRALRASV